MLRAQHCQQEYADNRHLPVPIFKVANKVWFNTQNVTTQCPIHELDYQHIGSFKIIKVVFLYAYKLQFPTAVKYHLV